MPGRFRCANDGDEFVLVDKFTKTILAARDVVAFPASVYEALSENYTDAEIAKHIIEANDRLAYNLYVDSSQVVRKP